MSVLELNPDQIAFRDTARKFAETFLAPNAAKWDQEKVFPKEAFVEAGKLGFMSLYVQEEDGGIGLGRLDSAIIMDALASGCTSTAAFISIHNMAINMLARYATETFKEAWMPGLTEGRLLASYCLTEPGSGSDAASLKSTAQLEGDHYLINGSKVFISGAGETDLLVAMLRTGESGPKGISCIAIPSDSLGISFGRLEDKMGWNNQPTRMINFDNVRVPADHLLAQTGQGFRLAMEGLDGGRINIAACSLGTAKASLKLATEYVKERKQFDQLISKFQATRFKIADCLTELVAAEQMIHLAAYKLDQRAPDRTAYCAMAKRFATDIGFRVCDESLQMLGGYGYTKEYPLERHVRDTRVHRILEGTNEVMRLIIARDALDNEALQLIDHL